MQERKDILFCFSDFAVGTKDNQVHHRGLRSWNDDNRPWDVIVGPGRSFSSIAPLPSGISDFQVHVGNLYIVGMQSNFVATFTLIVRREKAGETLRFAEDIPVLENWNVLAAWRSVAWPRTWTMKRLFSTDIRGLVLTKLTVSSA